MDPADSFDLVNPQTANRYTYVWNSPLVLVDADGREPNKAQAVTPHDFVATIKKLEAANPGAGPASVLKMTNEQFKAGVDARYVATSEQGWIDGKHFFAAADTASSIPLVGEVATNLLGVGVELVQTAQGNDSAFSYEDLGSNAAGADFGASVFEPNGAPLSSQVADYMSTLGAGEPLAASNYGSIPDTPGGTSGARVAQSTESRTGTLDSAASGGAASRSVRRER